MKDGGKEVECLEPNVPERWMAEASGGGCVPGLAAISVARGDVGGRKRRYGHTIHYSPRDLAAQNRPGSQTASGKPLATFFVLNPS
jgi:hypothetical protein